MNDVKSNQSVKGILQNIKEAISNRNEDVDKVESKENIDDVLYLEDEYLENFKKDHQEEEDSQKNNNTRNGEIIFDKTKFYAHNCNSHKKEEIHFRSDTQIKNEKKLDNIYLNKNNDYLILKENIEEIRKLLESVQIELQCKQQKMTNLTVEELITSLLKPQLSEWLNKHLHALVREIIEKELKNIIGSK
ncbi:MAG: DUF2497 domain-containing protein [Wolbachia endosymbiont of Meromenopon meropis]|nr:DUF2497 domain-containing protein [Wolbachia endosymbiont of Meromenopon meropis]